MSMLDWARQEIMAAKHKEKEDVPEGEFDYGGGCYDSALKAFESLLSDGHSGMSIKVTQGILNRLINGQPLTPIEDGEDIWGEAEKRYEENGDSYTTQQCIRKSSLFKYVYHDGTIRYHDVDYCRCVNVDNENDTYSSGLVSNLIHEMYPITMPYYPSPQKIKVICREFLLNPENGDYDTVGILTAVQSNGLEVQINKFYKEVDRKWVEIQQKEYDIRYDCRVKKEL